MKNHDDHPIPDKQIIGDERSNEIERRALGTIGGYRFPSTPQAPSGKDKDSTDREKAGTDNSYTKKQSG